MQAWSNPESSTLQLVSKVSGSNLSDFKFNIFVVKVREVHNKVSIGGEKNVIITIHDKITLLDG